MVDALSFRLPDAAQTVRPVLQVGRTIRDKDYILVVAFEGAESAVERESVPLGLLWSTSLDCPFAYLPKAESATIIRLEEFRAPRGTTSVTLTIRQWGSAIPNLSSPFSDVVLETTVIDRPAVVIGKEA